MAVLPIVAAKHNVKIILFIIGCKGTGFPRLNDCKNNAAYGRKQNK